MDAVRIVLAQKWPAILRCHFYVIDKRVIERFVWRSAGANTGFLGGGMLLLLWFIVFVWNRFDSVLRVCIGTILCYSGSL